MEQAKRTTTYRRPATDAAREKANAYRRRYRQQNPDRVKKWRTDYILRKAARLMAEQEQVMAHDGDLHDGQDAGAATDGR